MQATFYDVVDGRFISRDPIGELGGLNLYSYVRNNPLVYVDVLGFQRYRGATLPDIFIYVLSPQMGSKVMELAREAIRQTNKRFESLVHHNNKADAYRHALWSALIAKEFGKEVAIVVGVGHELDILQPIEEIKMDIYNNIVGIKLSQDPRCPNDYEGIAKFVYEEGFLKGKLQVSINQKPLKPIYFTYTE